MAEPISIQEQIAEVKRELSLRERVYPRLIAGGKITAQIAERNTARLIAVLRTLELVERHEPMPRAMAGTLSGQPG